MAPAALHARVMALDALGPTLEAVRSLIGATSMHHPALSDEALLDLEHPHPTGPAKPAGVLVDAPCGHGLVGFGSLLFRGSSWTVEPLARPGPGIGAEDVVGAILEAALRHVSLQGGGVLRLWLHGTVAGARSAGALGFRPERELLQLRVPLPLAAAYSPLALRTFRPGIDDDAWLRVNNRAFADHPEQSGWTHEDLVRREAEPWFDASGFLLHDETTRLGAFCWTKVHAAEGLGEIYVIGVDPDFQGRGLGRAMTQAGLDHLASLGIPTGMLYVDAANVAAVSLYRSLGFTRHHADRALVCDVEPATGPPSRRPPRPGTSQVPRDAPTPRPIP